MSTRSLQCAIVISGLAFAAPQAAWADSKPCLIKVIGLQAPWTVTKACPAADGKVKLYDTEPEYDLKSSIRTDELQELKAEGSAFTFKKGTTYWMVYYPKSRTVAVKLEFVKGYGASDNKTTLLVEGDYMALKWWSGPTVTDLYQNPSDKNMSVLAPAAFGKGITPKGKPEQVFLTLK